MFKKPLYLYPPDQSTKNKAKEPGTCAVLSGYHQKYAVSGQIRSSVWWVEELQLSWGVCLASIYNPLGWIPSNTYKCIHDTRD